jgi:aryl-alcohol dehydrogenase-like predicted oxidoreductase
MNPLCVAEGIGIIPWSPLARGVLAGNRKSDTVRARTDEYSKHLYGKEFAASDEKIIEQVQQLAQRKGVPPAQIALAWHLHKPGVVAPIVGASKPQHLEDAISALSVTLTPEEIAALEQPYVPHPIAGHG